MLSEYFVRDEIIELIPIDKIIYRTDGRIEWRCEHGIGHTMWHPVNSDTIHGCDECCLKFIEGVKNDKRIRQN